MGCSVLGAQMLTHDFSECRWGHNYNILSISGNQIRLVGWSLGVQEGDYLILNKGNSTTRYRVTEVNYKSAPHDMWEATAVFSPRAA